MGGAIRQGGDDRRRPRPGPRDRGSRGWKSIPLSEVLGERTPAGSGGGAGERAEPAPGDPNASLVENLARLDSVVHDFLTSLGQVPPPPSLEGAASASTARFQRILAEAPAPGGMRLGPPVLCGTSPEVGLESVFSFLGTLRKTGILRVRAEGTTFVISVVKGDVVHGVSHPRPEAELLGRILVARGVIDAYALSHFLGEFSASASRIGEALTREELVRTADLREALEIQLQKMFDRLLAARTSEWCFHEGEATLSYVPLRLSATRVLLESARSRDEGGK